MLYTSPRRAVHRVDWLICSGFDKYLILHIRASKKLCIGRGGSKMRRWDRGFLLGTTTLSIENLDNCLRFSYFIGWFKCVNFTQCFRAGFFESHSGSQSHLRTLRCSSNVWLCSFWSHRERGGKMNENFFEFDLSWTWMQLIRSGQQHRCQKSDAAPLCTSRLAALFHTSLN